MTQFSCSTPHCTSPLPLPPGCYHLNACLPPTYLSRFLILILCLASLLLAIQECHPSPPRTFHRASASPAEKLSHAQVTSCDLGGIFSTEGAPVIEEGRSPLDPLPPLAVLVPSTGQVGQGEPRPPALVWRLGHMNREAAALWGSRSFCGCTSLLNPESPPSPCLIIRSLNKELFPQHNALFYF